MRVYTGTGGQTLRDIGWGMRRGDVVVCRFDDTDRKTQTWESFEAQLSKVVHTTELWFLIRYGQEHGL